MNPDTMTRKQLEDYVRIRHDADHVFEHEPLLQLRMFVAYLKGMK